MRRTVTWQDRFRYRFDRLLSRGSAAAIGWVVWIAVLLALVGGVVFWAFGIDFDGRTGPVESFWQAFLIAIGSGGIVDVGWMERLVTFVFVFAGVFLTGSLVGVLVAAVTKRLDELRRGRSRVLESGHTVVVGWSPRLMSVIDELLAEDPRSRGVSVVVLADRDKQSMEDAFRARYQGRERNRVLFRTGNPSLRADLELVGVDTARAVIVLSGGSQVDAVAVRRALAAFEVEPDDAHVVAELVNPRVARSLVASTDGGVAAVTIGEVVADMFAQAVRAAGMAEVFDQLLSFGGQELYVMPAGDLAGTAFYESNVIAEGVVTIGIVDGERDAVLLPPSDRMIASDDQLVVVAENSQVRASRSTGSHQPADWKAAAAPPASIVMIGWNEMAPGVLERLAGYLPDGSRVEVLADSTLLEGGTPSWTWSIDGGFTHTKHDPRHVIDTIARAEADVVAILGYSAGMTDEEADAMSLLTLLTLDRARDTGELAAERIVAHLFDNELATLARAHADGDFVITDALASRMLVHTSRDRHMSAIYTELFDALGPIIDTIEVEPGSISYGDIVAGLASAQVVPLGVIVDGELTLNPLRSTRLEFGPDDCAVVIRSTQSLDVPSRSRRVARSGPEDGPEPPSM